MPDIDRTPKPCLHPQANHEHGTRTCYTLDACRCLPCSAGMHIYEQNRIRQHAYGRWDNLVDAGPAREHAIALRKRGMGRRTIARRAGVSESAITNLIWGRTRPNGRLAPTARLRKGTADKILALEFDPADNALVPAIGAVRRIRALVALGWSQAKLSAALGFNSPTQLTGIANNRTEEIFARNDRAITALYERLSMQLPPEQTHRDKISASRARNYAISHGWEPPLAWDDESIDDLAAAPYMTPDADDTAVDEAAIERRMAGDKSVELTSEERTEAVRRMLARGDTHKSIERRAGLNAHRYPATPQGVPA